MKSRRIGLFLTVLLGAGVFTEIGVAQNAALQEKIAEVKNAAAANRQELTQYTWVEQQTISLKGEQKKQEQFQVRLGPDGKPQKTSLDQQEASSEDGRRGRLKRHVIEKKTEDLKDYAEQVKSLMQQYVPPDKDKLEQAYQAGNVTLGAEPGSTDEYSLVISNYIKPGDKMTLVMNKAAKEIASISISSYLDDPKDAVNLSVTFARVPNGPNHVSTATIDCVSKQLTIAIENSNYQKL